MLTIAAVSITIGILASCLLRARNRGARLQGLLHRLLNELQAQKKSERERIARELHDGLGQLLIAARHSLELAYERRAVPAESDAFLQRGLEQLADAIREARGIAYDMKSLLLQRHEFSEALGVLCREFGQGANIRTECLIAEQLADLVLPAPASAALIRIAQEALTNVARHAAASCVRVFVDADAHYVELRVVDDGRGLDAASAGGDVRCGIGLNNMRERAAALGGTLLARDLGCGTEIRARLPLALPSNSYS